MSANPYDHISDYVRFLTRMRPKSILDVGMGNGRLGYVARHLFNAMDGLGNNEVRLRLDGIDRRDDHIKDPERAVYDDIHIGDAFEVIDHLGDYDMVIMGDVLGSFPKERGWLFLDKCLAHANQAAALFVPLGKGWKHATLDAKPEGSQGSCWEPQELIPASSDHAIIDYDPGLYGAFLLPKAGYREHRVQMLKTSAFFPETFQTVNGIRGRYGLNRAAIDPIDLSILARHTPNAEYRGYFLDSQFKEHYRLLAYLSTLFNDQILFDVGTLKGYSALALSYNRANKIVSYDIEDLKDLAHPEELPHIEYRLGNVLDDPRLLSAPLILLDTYHDGTFEAQFYEHLKRHQYKGLLVLDDIHLNDPMRQFWKAIQEPKDDLTDLGHWSGTGLVDFTSAYQA